MNVDNVRVLHSLKNKGNIVAERPHAVERGHQGDRQITFLIHFASQEKVFLQVLSAEVIFTEKKMK
jgi:hypothetical protein